MHDCSIMNALSTENYLDQQEERKVREEALDYKRQREEVVRTFELLQGRLVALLEENLRERPLHQLSLAEFNLHLEYKKERLKQVGSSTLTRRPYWRRTCARGSSTSTSSPLKVQIAPRA